MTPIDQSQLGTLKQRADDLVALAAKAAIHAHLSYHHSLDTAAVTRGDVEAALKTYGGRLAQLRATVTGQFDTVMGLVGGSTSTPEGVSPGSTPDEVQHAVPVLPVLTPIQKLGVALEFLGELTNAQVQKFMRCDADGAREIIDELVKQGLVEKVSPKVYKSIAQKEPVS